MALLLCNKIHDVVVYSEKNSHCPACELIHQNNKLQQKVDFLECRVESLQYDLDNLKHETQTLKEEIIDGIRHEADQGAAVGDNHQ